MVEMFYALTNPDDGVLIKKKAVQGMILHFLKWTHVLMIKVIITITL